MARSRSLQSETVARETATWASRELQALQGTLRAGATPSAPTAPTGASSSWQLTGSVSKDRVCSTSAVSESRSCHAGHRRRSRSWEQRLLASGLFLTLLIRCKSSDEVRQSSALTAEQGVHAPASIVPARPTGSTHPPTAGDGQSAPWAIVENAEHERLGVSVIESEQLEQLQVEWCIEPRRYCGRYLGGQPLWRRVAGDWCVGCRPRFAGPEGRSIELRIFEWYPSRPLPPEILSDRLFAFALTRAARAAARRTDAHEPADAYTVIADAAGFTKEHGCDGAVDLWLRLRRATAGTAAPYLAPYLEAIPCETTVDQSFRMPLRLSPRREWDSFFTGAIVRANTTTELSLLDLPRWAAAVRSTGWTDHVARKLLRMVETAELDRLNRLRAALMLRVLRELGRTSGSKEPDDDRGPVFEDLERLMPRYARRPTDGTGAPVLQ